MTVEEAICRRRSIREFENRTVDKAELLRLVELARLYACGGNRQPLRFGILTNPQKTEKLFQHLHWAMYLPEYMILPQNRPPAYIILLRDEKVCKNCGYEIGAASTSVFLAAEERGLKTCALGSFDAGFLRELMEIPSNLCPELVIAIGYGAQQSCIVPYVDTMKYRQEENGTFCVPKLSLTEVLAFADGDS